MQKTLLLLLLFFAYQHKAAGVKVRLSKNDNDGVSHGVDCSQKGDRIPPLKGVFYNITIIIALINIIIIIKSYKYKEKSASSSTKNKHLSLHHKTRVSGRRHSGCHLP